MLVHRTGLLPFLCMSIAASPAGAFDPNYGPFPPSDRPKVFPLQRCVEWNSIQAEDWTTSSEWILGLPNDVQRTHTHIRIVQPASGNLSLEIRGSDERIIAGPQDVSDAAFFGASTGDLNVDGKPDFIVETTCFGCGLACWYRTLAFAISKGNEYEISAISTMFREECDLVDLDHDGRCELIHVAMAWSSESDERDAKSHAYWVFHKLQITDGRWILAKLDKLFPRWVWYTYRPNQKATQRLSEAAKNRIWRAHGGDDQIFWSVTQRGRLVRDPFSQPLKRESLPANDPAR